MMADRWAGVPTTTSVLATEPRLIRSLATGVQSYPRGGAGGNRRNTRFWPACGRQVATGTRFRGRLAPTYAQIARLARGGQRQLATLSPRSKLIVAQRSGHD